MQANSNSSSQNNDVEEYKVQKAIELEEYKARKARELEEYKVTQSRLIEEYKSLRDELRINRGFVFERPILILGAAATFAAASARSENFFAIALLPIPFLLALWFNLWFTVNRLMSNSRIIAYIYLFLEVNSELKDKWKGWENALVAWRDHNYYPRPESWNGVLRKSTSRGSKSADIQSGSPESLSKLGKAETPTPRPEDPMGFYPPIFSFHRSSAVLVTFAFVAWASARLPGCLLELWCARDGIYPNVIFLTDLFCLVFWGFYTQRHYGPDKIRSEIYLQIDHWRCVFGTNETSRPAVSDTPPPIVV